MIFDFFKTKRDPKYPSVDGTTAVTHVAHITGGAGIPAGVAIASCLRRRHTGQAPKRGMWVTYQGRTGILTDLQEGDIAEVMLVDQLGLNLEKVHRLATELEQAYFEDIPEPRRPDYDTAVRFGYVSRDSGYNVSRG